LNTESLDKAVAVLGEQKDTWAQLPIGEKIGFLRGLRRRTGEVADRWVEAAVRAKGIPLGSPWAGEEWLSGPYAFLYAINAIEKTMQALARGRVPDLKPGTVRVRPDGQLVVQVFPADLHDRLLLSGVRAEVWMQRGVTPDNLRSGMAAFYRRTSPEGKVALVLGAGNIASIAPLDILHKLYTEGQVCILKMNPVNDYLGPIFEEIFDDLEQRGFVRIAYGGEEVGSYLVGHPVVDEIHMTGSERTYDAIRFGSGAKGAERKRCNEPVNRKRFTAELGGIGPTIVLPGPWSKADIQFQAEHIATQKFHNVGFNCIASQVLVLPASWGRKNQLLDALRATIRSIPPRKPYYPGAQRRQAEVARAYPEAEFLDAPGEGVVPRTLVAGVNPGDASNLGFTEEFFCGALLQTALPGDTPAKFLREAVRFANDALRGSLGANLIVHPATLSELGPDFEAAIADLRYGTIGVNGWVGVAFLLPQATWGAFPGHADNDIQSGRGVVHNALQFDKPERTVVYAPFEPFPRCLTKGRFSLLPKPPWFVTHRHADVVGRRLTRFAVDPGFSRLPGIFEAALRG
jgi:aldehyde dehydrogenase (NAD(P)+)